MPVAGDIQAAAGAVSLLVGVAGALRGPHYLHRRRIRRAALRVPLLDDDTVDGARARAVGVVRATTTLVAPLSGKPVVAALSSLGARPSQQWFALAPFVLERAGAPAIAVDGTSAELDLPRIRLRWGPFVNAATRDRRRALEIRLGYTATTAAQRRQAGQIGLVAQINASFSYREIVLAPGTRIAVAGTLLRDVADPKLPGAGIGPPELGFRDQPVLLRLSGNPQFPLLISAAPL